MTETRTGQEYLCLVYFEPTVFDGMSRAEKQAFDAESMAYDRELDRQGALVAARALRSPATAVTVAVRASGLSSTDGPFAETKEHLGGFILVRATDMNHAKILAAGIPLARLGRIEVRPIMTIGED